MKERIEKLISEYDEMINLYNKKMGEDENQSLMQTTFTEFKSEIKIFSKFKSDLESLLEPF